MVQFLVYMVFTSLISLETIKLLFRVAVPFYVPTNNVWVIQFLFIFLALDVVITFFNHSDMEWYFIMLICIYPMTNNVEIFSHAYSSSVTSLHWNICSCLLPILPTGFILYFTTEFQYFFFLHFLHTSHI